MRDSIRGSAIVANVSRRRPRARRPPGRSSPAAGGPSHPRTPRWPTSVHSRTARAGERPSSSSRWWRCCCRRRTARALPAYADDREQEVESGTARPRPRHERSSAAAGSARSGTPWGELSGQRDEDAASSSPISSAPESPMKTRAGLEVVRENPTHTHKHAVISAARWRARGPGRPRADTRTRSRRGSADRDHAGGQPVEAVDHVPRVHRPDDHQHLSSVPCAAESEVSVLAGQRDPVERDALDDHHAGRSTWPASFVSRRAPTCRRSRRDDRSARRW